MGNPIPPQDYANLFEKRIFNRAVQYYRDGNVLEFDEITPDLWHGVIAGTEDYDVDVRIHAGRVLSAACSCPYAQEHTYCKHVGALIIAIEHRINTEQGAENLVSPALRASNAVFWYWSELIGTSALTQRELSTDDWQAIRHILEHLYGFPDLQPYIETVHLARTTGHNDRYQTAPHDPMPQFFNDLPHGWLTILEAAYEHLDDTAGLRRLYILYILLATHGQEAVYVQLLRDISKNNWKEDLKIITDLAYANRFELNRRDNPAYERVLREEELVKESQVYTAMHFADNRMLRFLPILARENPEQLLESLMQHFRQPDIDIYQGDSKTVASRVSAWVRAIDRVFGIDAARELTEWILTMFPKRRTLHKKLKEYGNVSD